MSPSSAKSGRFWHWGLVLVGLSWGCATTKDSARGVEVAGAGPAKRAEGAAPTEPQVSSRAKLLFEDAVKDLDKQRKTGKYDYASLERRFRAAADADPHLGEADFNLGVLAERQGKSKEAFDHYKNALAKKPSLRQAAENMAVIMQNSGNEEGALSTYQNILETYPEDASSRARLAEIHRRRGEHEKAVELARDALFRDPKTLTAYKVMMQSYLEQKQLALAKLVALRALKLNDNDAEILYTIGLIQLGEKEPAKAREQFKRAVAARPDFLPAHMLLARMALEQEDYAGAEESIRRLLQADGSNAEAHLNLGVAYKGMGQFDKALAEYDAAQKLNANLPAIYLNRGIILAQVKGQPEKAIEYYRQYIQMSGSDLDAEHSVHGLIKESEQVIENRETEKRALEEAKKMEEEAKRQEEALKAEEKKKKDEEFKKAQDRAKGKAAEEGEKAAIEESDAARRDCLQSAKTERAKKDCEAIGRVEGKPEPKKEEAKKPEEKKPEEKKPEEKKTSPPAKKNPDEPSDEPL